MRLEDLPTSDVWGAYDWQAVLSGDWSNSYTGAHFAPLGEQAPDITPERIARVYGWRAESPEGYGSINFACVVELTDGTWAACMAWADTTGWGCQDGVEWRVARDLSDVVAYGLDQRGRTDLGMALEGSRLAIEG